jgi:hypothetical protein
VGALFVTTDQELRKVLLVRADDHGRTVVWYQSKSATVPNRPFLLAHPQSDAPTLDEFVAQCAQCLSWTESCRLRERGILLECE